MKVNQLSVFLENKPGRLSHPCKTLADAGVNVLTLSLADTHQFGILRLIVRDWQKAKAALEKDGYVVNVTEVVAIEVPDRPGGLAEVLAESGINILTLSRADTQQFGILRRIVRDWQKAKKALEKSGCVVNVTEVVAVEVADKPGGLEEVLEVIEQARINVEYMYAFTFRSQDKAVLVFRFEDPDGAVAALKAKGISVIGSVELYKKVEKL
jgi:hypothetical protein